MLEQHVDMVVAAIVSEEACACALPMPPGPTPLLWGPEAVKGVWAKKQIQMEDGKYVSMVHYPFLTKL